MTEQTERFWQEGIDGKRMFLHLWRHLWLILAGTAAGALLCAGLYLPFTAWRAGETKYAAVSQYYLTFHTDEFGDVYDYYNAYTWNHDVITCDAITEYALQFLPGTVTKETLKESVTAELPGDQRFMTVTATAADPALADSVMEAYTKTLPHFAEITKGLGDIVLTQQEPAQAVPVDYRTGSALFLGALLGLTVTLFTLLLWYGLDDSFYVEEDVKRRFPYPVLGQITKKRDASFLRELDTNCRRISGEKKTFGLTGTDEKAVREAKEVLGRILAGETAGCAESNRMILAAADLGTKIGGLTQEDRVSLRNAEGGVILALPYGGRDGRAAEHLAGQLEQQGCAVCGVVLVGGSEWFLKRYYGKKRFSK